MIMECKNLESAYKEWGRLTKESTEDIYNCSPLLYKPYTPLIVTNVNNEGGEIRGLGITVKWNIQKENKND